MRIPNGANIRSLIGAPPLGLAQEGPFLAAALASATIHPNAIYIYDIWKRGGVAPGST
jgi:hypothetical protein